jgi:dihydropyrimidine dehydrogenase (NAD+) subunit PreT
VKKEKSTSVNIGKRVAVIGAGNTSIDAATEAVRLGAKEAMILYRRSEEEMSAYKFEFELAKNDGVVFHFLTSPKKIIGQKYVEAIECVKMDLTESIKGGRRKPLEIPNSNYVIPVDMVIKAIGQSAKTKFLNSIPGLKINNDKLEVNPANYQTGNPKVFAGGDCINGGKEVVNAAYDGKQAAKGIHSFLSE